MDISLAAIISWVIVGALAGTLVGGILSGRKSGYGMWKNLGIGLIGAVIGGFVFRLLKIDFGLGEIKITAADVIAAILGALLFLLILKLAGKKRA